MNNLTIESQPYRWPYNGELRPDNTALLIIDMQIDFCGKGGYVDLMGYDISQTRACIEPINRVLTALRQEKFHIIHTRRVIAPTCPIFRRTSAGAHAKSAPVSAIPARAAKFSCAVNLAGK